jgi:hypothetical protein
MYIGTKRSPEKIIALWVMSFGLYGIYWLAQTFSELQTNRKKGISGRSYAVLAVLFPPLAVSACWLLPAYVGRLYAENGKLEQISSCWGAMLFLPTIALWAIVGMAYLIIGAGGTITETGMYMFGGIVAGALAINVFLLYNWLKKIQLQINEFWDEAAAERS